MKFIKKTLSSVDLSVFTVSLIIFESTHRSEFMRLNSDVVMKLTAVNLNNSQTDEASKIKQFFYVEIFISETKSAVKILTEKVKTFLCIEISKRK